MTSKTETVEAPDQQAIVESLWASFSKLGSPVHMPAGTVLFREGEPVKGIFLLSKGSVRLSLGRNHKSITYRVAAPKYILGLPATLLHRPYSLTAETVTDSELRFIDSATAMDFLRDHGDVCMHILEFLSHEMVWIRNVHAEQLESSKSGG